MDSASISLCQSNLLRIRPHPPFHHLLHQLGSLAFNFFNYPYPSLHHLPSVFPRPPAPTPPRWPSQTAQITPVAFTSLLFGISSALMLLGSFAFFIGMMMLPFVAFAAVVVLVGAILNNISTTGASLWCRNGTVSSQSVGCHT